jgi:hypothetical protein
MRRRAGRFAAGMVVAMMLPIAACGDDTDTIADDAETRLDEAEAEADDLQEEVEDKLDDAGEAVDEGLARGQAEIFKQRLTDLGGDETPTLAVDELERIGEELPADPEVSGIDDADGDGDDDDGKVQITVDGASACVTIAGSSVEVADGTC